MYDRIPLYPGRVKMTPVAGQANTYDMTRADDPTQAGTPLNKASLLKDATAALFGLTSAALPDDVLAEIGKYKQYWWRRRVPKTTGYIEVQKEESNVQLVNYNNTPVTYSYGDTIFIDQSSGAVSINNPITTAFSLYGDFSILKGKYITSGSTIYYLSADATIKSYKDDDTEYVYVNTCQRITSKYVSGEAGSWQYLQSSNRNAYPDSGTQDGYEYEYLGVPFDNAVTAPKIEVGSYVGTDTHGASNPNTLTFGFVPKLVWFYAFVNNQYSYWYNPGDEVCAIPYMVLPTEYGNRFPPYGGSGPNNNSYSKRDGETLTWYNVKSASEQLNSSTYTYYYFAIG